MYCIQVSRRPKAYRETIQDAIDYARAHVYLSAGGISDAQKSLEAGRKYEYTYGFNTASIIPDVDPAHEIPVICENLKAIAEHRKVKGTIPYLTNERVFAAALLLILDQLEDLRDMMLK
jgi:hypothetical protein